MIRNLFLKLSRWYLCNFNNSSKIRNFIIWPLATRVLGLNYKTIVTLKNGLKIKTDLGDMLGRLVVFYGADLDYFWEPQTTKLMEKLIVDAICAIDAGSHIGYLAVKARQAMKKDDSVLHSFEPVTYLYDIAKENFALNNNLGRGYINHAALSDFNGVGNVCVNNLCSTIIESSESKHMTEKVQILTIDNYLRKQKISKIDFLLLDVEGNEPKVFAGMKETLRLNQPRDIIFEYSAKIKGGSHSWRDYLVILEPFGYDFYFINDNYNLKNIRRDIGAVELTNISTNLSLLTNSSYCNILATKRTINELRKLNIIIN